MSNSKGLSKRIGGTDWRVEYGAHYPWSHRLMRGEACVCGLDLDGWRQLRAALRSHHTRELPGDTEHQGGEHD